jgi:delta 1-pyrroline-5-carboxylate dehydrogenase
LIKGDKYAQRHSLVLVLYKSVPLATNMTALDFTQFYNVIEGRLETTAATTHGINPSTLEPNPAVPLASEGDVDRAVAAARKAFEVWSETPLHERRQALVAFADSLAENKAGFARMLTTEQGKPLAMAEMEIDACVRWLKQQANLPFPEDVIADTEEQRITTSYTPLGVAAAIVPWNCMYPCSLDWRSQSKYSTGHSSSYACVRQGCAGTADGQCSHPETIVGYSDSVC